MNIGKLLFRPNKKMSTVQIFSQCGPFLQFIIQYPHVYSHMMSSENGHDTSIGHIPCRSTVNDKL